MRAGRLDRLILIEEAATGDNGYNETETWAVLAKVPAQYIPSAGREAREQAGREALLPASFRIRWSPSLEQLGPGANRLRFPATDDGQVWDIKSVVEVGRREAIEIVALARVGSAS